MELLKKDLFLLFESKNEKFRIHGIQKLKKISSRYNFSKIY